MDPKDGWIKSSASNGGGGQCVEVNFVEEPGTILVRDSKNPEGPRLAFTPGEWGAFVKGVELGEFDL